MPFDAPDVRLGAIAPELTLAAGALLLLLFDALLGDKIPRGRTRGRWHLPVLATAIVALAATFAVDEWRSFSESGPRLHLAGAVALDGFSAFVKLAVATFALLTIWAARDYLVRDEIEEPEFYGLTLFAAAGMMLMASAADLIVLFLALESFSIALYVLAGFRRYSVAAQEAALKYFLLGAFSSAFFLLGIALAFGATGSTNFYASQAVGGGPGLSGFLREAPASEAGLLVLATGLLVIGLGFKVAAVPFHMWTPDAYQGAPAPVTGFMAAGSKIAGFAALLRLLDVVLVPLRWDWQPLVIGIAVLTMVAGSILAVVQEDLKRLLAYSSIAHAGFLLIGIVAASDSGISASLFYLATYGVTVIGAFTVVAVVGGRNETRLRLVDLRGLFFERPLMAGAITLFLLSLAGVPLTSGFVAKLLVFAAAIDAGYAWLVVVGALASAIAAFFYLRVMVVMYMQEPEVRADDESQPVGSLSAGTIGLAAAATIVLGIIWGPLADLAEQAKLFFS